MIAYDKGYTLESLSFKKSHLHLPSFAHKTTHLFGISDIQIHLGAEIQFQLWNFFRWNIVLMHYMLLLQFPHCQKHCPDRRAIKSMHLFHLYFCSSGVHIHLHTINAECGYNDHSEFFNIPLRIKPEFIPSK